MDHLFDDLSEQAHKAIARSETIAKQYPATPQHVKPIHLLYALSRQQGSLAKTFLTAYNIAPRTILAFVKQASAPKKHAARFSPNLAPDTIGVLRKAHAVAKKHDQQFVGTEHLLFALLHEDTSPFPKDVSMHIQDQIRGLLEHAVQLPVVKTHKHTHEEDPLEDDMPPRRHISPLRAYCRDLTAQAPAIQNPLVGRHKELDRVIRVLLRHAKNNPLLVGDPGVGKSAIVQGLAYRIRTGSVPDQLVGTRLLMVDMPALIAGTMFRGEFESRVRDLVEEARKSNVILYIDELHTITGAGAAQGSMDAANMLKPALAHGDIRCIGATTFEEYAKYIEKDAALARRFGRVAIHEETLEEARRTLEETKHLYERHHNITIPQDAIEAAVALASRYIQDRALPDKALDVLDEAASFAKQEGMERLSPSHIAAVIAEATGIPAGAIGHDERRRYRMIERELAESVIGQDHATGLVAATLKRKKAGIGETGRPFGSFLFVGPSGVGKTELAKALARVIGDSPIRVPKNLIALDMSEYSEAHNIARLIGSPPGYVGYEEGGQLTDRVRRMPYSVVLFDEIEKAHPHVLNILLQILEEGSLTDGQGRRVSFAQTLIVLTSNIGTEMWEGRHTLGFAKENTELQTKKQHVIGQVKELIRPEIINRLDHIVVFNSLAKKDIRTIAHNQLRELCGRLSPDRSLRIAPSVISWVAERAIAEDKGARGVRAVIAAHIEPQLADYILAHNPRAISVATRKKNIVVR